MMLPMMPPITLRVVAKAGEPEPTPLLARFDEAGGLIGRAESARLVLPDTRRTVSRFHAHVSHAEGSYYIEDMGSTNTAQLNGQPLASGQKARLALGDRVQIGDYTLAVDAADAPLPARANAVPAASGGDDEATRLVPRTASAQDSQRPPATPEALWQAFEEGVGVKIDLPLGLRPELMRVIGSMLAGSVSGLRRLLQLRAASKRQVDLDVTTIRTRNNNPLKFAQDTDRALLALLKPPVHGFLPGTAAVDDAVDDLESHALATMVALRQAVEHTLARFDPAMLEQRLVRGSLLDALLPMNRKARLWELYLEQQRVIRQEAEEGFDEAFTRAFAEAYEREVGRLKAHRGS
jgi:predicted component of type VI protein secretion system